MIVFSKLPKVGVERTVSPLPLEVVSHTRRGAKASPTVGSLKHRVSVCKAPEATQSSPCTNWI